MYLTALMQVTRLGCEIPRSKERPTNPLMNNFNTYSSPLMKIGSNPYLTSYEPAENTKTGKNHI